MPKLIPDQEESALFLHPKTGDFYVRKYVAGRGEICRSLQTKNRREAIRRKNEILIQWGAGLKRGRRVRFESIAFELLEIQSGKSERTFADYEGHLRLHLLPFFRGRFLDEVQSLWPHYKLYCRKLKATRKLDHDRKHLLAICRLAYERELIHRLPELKLDPQDRHARPGRVYSGDEVQRLLDALPQKHKGAREKWRLIIEMAAILGMRRGEIFQLTWNQIDFTNEVIVLGRLDTKTRQGRLVPLEQGILESLKTRKAESKSIFVFPHRNDPTRPMTMSDKTWQRVKRRSGVEGRTFHGFRHSNVTWGQREGFSAGLISKTRGMSREVMENIYTHAELEDAKRLGDGIRKQISIRTDSENTESDVSNDSKLREGR